MSTSPPMIISPSSGLPRPIFLNHCIGAALGNDHQSRYCRILHASVVTRAKIVVPRSVLGRAHRELPVIKVAYASPRVTAGPSVPRRVASELNATNFNGN